MGQLGYLLPSRRLFRMCCRGEESESERDNTLQHRKQMIIVFSHCVFFTAFLCFPLCFLFIYLQHSSFFFSLPRFVVYFFKFVRDSMSSPTKPHTLCTKSVLFAIPFLCTTLNRLHLFICFLVICS